MATILRKQVTVSMRNILVLLLVLSLVNSCKTTRYSLTYDKGVVINGIKWATRNVAAPGTFAAIPQDPGMFYQWNSATGWRATKPMINSNGETEWILSDGNNAKTWETSNNICPAGWRVPTKDELTSLAAAAGEWTITPVDGRIFGKGKNKLFLPAAGFRDRDNGSLQIAGSGGYYWSSTVDNDTNTNAYGLYFYSENVHPGGNNDRSYGFSVRCVAK